MYLNWPLLLPKPVKKGSEMDPSVNRKGCQQRVPPQPKCQKQFLILPLPPRALQERSKGTQSHPRLVQEPPKTSQGSPGAAQGTPRRRPNPSKFQPWDLQQAFSAASSSGRASGAVGDRFFDYVAMLRKSSKGDFSAHTRCFMRFLPC